MSEDKFLTFNEHNKTVFDTLTKVFPNSNEILRTAPFIEICTSAVTLMDFFGKAFAPVTHDMANIISKLNSIYLEDKENYTFFEAMVLNEHTQGKMFVVEGVIWLERLLRFLCIFLQMIISDMEEPTNK